jgi:hypothetical protein
MKTECLLRQNKYHTTAWVEAEAIKLGLRVEIAELGGLWETVEIYPYRLTDELATGKAECAGGEHDDKFQQRLTHCSVLIQQGGGKRRADILAVEIKPGIVFHPTKYGSLFPHLFASSRHCGGKQRTGIIPL